MIGNKNWIANPTKKQVIFHVSLCLIGWVLLLLPMTNFFTESPFKRSYFIFYFILVSTMVTAIKVVLNYYRNKKNRLEL